MSSEPSSDLEGGDSAKRGPMSSLLGLPPTPLSSRLPIMSFVKGSNSSQVGSSSVSDGASTSANPSFGGGSLGGSKAAFSGSASAMGFVSGGTLMPNSSKPMLGGGSGSSMGFVSGFVSGGTLNASNKTSFSGSGTTGFGGSPNTASKLGGGGQSLLGTPNTSMYRSGNTNSLLPLPTDTTTTTTTTLITAPPAPKKKKSKDKDKNKPITEKFVKFIGGMSDDATTPDNMDKMANTVPLQSYGAKAGEKAQGFMQPGQSQQQQQQQPSTAAATATPQHK
ncbi:hypothetical protein E2C01_073169 [Portunus trituberculatus]|uniref:Uncharacterized protein n=1 Tax=Portunus trituberculatus TaxID=210409 RepID=A0A5B7IDA3_PORTR|nr:hypothetical protein [Portunus trituberculatus]